MYARMTIMMLQPDRMDEAEKIYRKSVVPSAKKQKGFQGICLLRDDQAGKGISVAFWKSKKDAEANEANLYYQEQLAKFVPLCVAPPTFIKEGYNVAVHIMQAKGPQRSTAHRSKKKK